MLLQPCAVLALLDKKSSWLERHEHLFFPQPSFLYLLQFQNLAYILGDVVHSFNNSGDSATTQ